jgi:DNA-directed RNA polymerase subunit RPC12/RpoP
MNIVRCGKCGITLNEASNIQPDKRLACPSCGSMCRLFEVNITENVEIGEKLGVKAKRANAKKPFMEQISGVDTHEQSSWYFKTQASPDLKLW